MPSGGNQAETWSKAVAEQLPGWIETKVIPVIQGALARDKLNVTLAIGGNENDSLLLGYQALAEGPDYVKPVVKLEFGGRATGEPHTVMPIQCDMDGFVPDVTFPTASPMVMDITRTFWDKATAARVYCAQRRVRGERFARHWYNLSAIAQSKHFPQILPDRAVAEAVAQHKSWFFREKGGRRQCHQLHRGNPMPIKSSPQE